MIKTFEQRLSRSRGKERRRRDIERERFLFLLNIREEANRKEMKDKVEKSWKWNEEMENKRLDHKEEENQRQAVIRVDKRKTN